MGTIWKENGTFEGNYTERGKSLWAQENYRYGLDEGERLYKRSFPELTSNITTEVAVIGAGLAGILTAYLLQEQGVSVVVLECREAGSGITKNTTANTGPLRMRIRKFGGRPSNVSLKILCKILLRGPCWTQAARWVTLLLHSGTWVLKHMA
jgi:glutamate dehydrogenase/leucine dehydrogenase